MYPVTSALRRRRVPRAALAYASVAMTTLVACEQATSVGEPGASNRAASASVRSGTFYGPAVPVGNGIARSYIVLESGEPAELGVAMNEGALKDLPDDVHHGYNHFHEYQLRLPQQNNTPIQFIELDWVPVGHEPPFDAPHFDFHFYVTTQAERDLIDPADPEFAEKAGNFPPAEYRPAGHLPFSDLVGAPPVAVAVPRMGVHWANPQAPVFAGAPYEEVFIFGSWDGRMTFYEPMITHAFIASKPNVTLPIGQAERYEPAGYYPSAYRIYWEPQRKEHRIALSGFSMKR